jgi:ribose transport system permease protein
MNEGTRRIPASRAPWRRRFAVLGPLLGLMTVTALFAGLRFETFVTWDNLSIILQQTTVIGVAALGMTLIIIAGGIDLSVGSVIALVTVVIALLMERGWPALAAAAGGVGVAAACGAVSGLLITGLRLLPFVVTLGLMGALRGAAKGLAGEQPVYPADSWLNGLMQLGLHGGPPAAVGVMFALAAVVALMLRYTRFGRHVLAVGSNELTARLCGVPVARVKCLVYLLGGSLAGVAAVFQFAYLTGGDPTTATGLELNIIAAVVIGGASLAGGQGTVTGTLVGALIMSVVANGCVKLGLSNWVQEIVTGAIIIAAVLLDYLRSREAADRAD